MSKAFILVALTVFGNSFSAQGSRIRTEFQPENCTSAGMVCSQDFSGIHICRKKYELSQLVRDCSKEGLLCVNKNNTITCGNGPPQTQRPVNFKCLEEGEYPDPTDCRVTYRCDSQRKVTKRCMCSGKNQYILPYIGLPCVISDKCPRKEIKCEEKGDQGAFTALDGTLYQYRYYCNEKPRVSSFESGGRPSPDFDQEVKKCTTVNEEPAPEPY